MASKRTKYIALTLCGLLMCATCDSLDMAALTVPAVDGLDTTAFGGQSTNGALGTYQMNGVTTAMTDTALAFTAVIDDDASFVSIKLPQWPQGVHFISAQSLPTRLADEVEHLDTPSQRTRAGALDDPDRGTYRETTTITIILSIDQAGEYTLPPLTVAVRKEEREALFPALHIIPNPDTAAPAVTLRAVDAKGAPISLGNVRVGQEVRLALAMRFVTKVEDVHWEVPDDAIFSAEYGNNERNTASSNTRSGDGYNRVPAAFLWQPLTAGQAVLPVISCGVVALNGKSCTITTREESVDVVEADAGEKHQEEAQSSAALFPDAFSLKEAPSTLSDGESDAHIVTYEKCKQLAMLREQEHRSVLPWRVRKERVAFEKSMGLPPGHNEMCRLPFAGCIVLFVVCAALSLSVAMRPSRRKMRLCASLPAPLLSPLVDWRAKRSAYVAASFLAASLAIFCTVVLSSRHGVFAGSVICPVPDEASSAIFLAPGTYVRIKDSAPPYVYIVTVPVERQKVKGTVTAGWALTEDVIAIR